MPHPWKAFWDAQAVLLRQPAHGQGPVGRTGRAAVAPKTGLHGGELRAARRRARGGQGQAEPARAGYQEVTVEDLCDLTHHMLVAAGIGRIDLTGTKLKDGIARSRANLVGHLYCVVPRQVPPQRQPQHDDEVVGLPASSRQRKRGFAKSSRPTWLQSV